MIALLGLLTFSAAALAQEVGEWSVADGVDIRVAEELDSVRFEPVELPDKFVTGERPASGYRAVSNGLVTYRWLPPIQNCSHAVFVPTAGTAWELGYLGQNGWKRLGGVGRVSANPELAIGNEAPALVSLERLPSGPCALYVVVSNHHYHHGGLWRPLEIGPSEELTNEFRQSFVLNVLVFSTLYCRRLPLIAWIFKRTRSSQSLLCIPLVDLMVRQGSTGFGVLSTWIARDEA